MKAIIDLQLPANYCFGMTISHEYVAGLFDGEGCISILKHPKGKYVYYRLDARINSVHPAAIEAIQNKYGGSLSKGKTLRSLTCRLQTTWQCGGQTAAMFLRAIAPYMIEKKEQAITAIAYMDTIDFLGDDRASKLERDRISIEYRDRLHLMKGYLTTQRLDPVSTAKRLMYAA